MGANSIMYDGPVREGNRGGQGDFRWANIVNDKHRENYLGSTINAPQGRWQKNKDIHWYARDVDSADGDEAARQKREEIKRLKEAEEDALSVALGFAPKKPVDGEGSGANAVPVKSEKDEELERAEKEERKKEKALRKELRALKRAEREVRREEKYKHRDERRGERPHRDDRDDDDHYERKSRRRDWDDGDRSDDDRPRRSRVEDGRSHRAYDGDRRPQGDRDDSRSPYRPHVRSRSRSRSRSRERGRGDDRYDRDVSRRRYD